MFYSSHDNKTQPSKFTKQTKANFSVYSQQNNNIWLLPKQQQFSTQKGRKYLVCDYEILEVTFFYYKKDAIVKEQLLVFISSPPCKTTLERFKIEKLCI